MLIVDVPASRNCFSHAITPAGQLVSCGKLVLGTLELSWAEYDVPLLLALHLLAVSDGAGELDAGIGVLKGAVWQALRPLVTAEVSLIDYESEG